ncbi:MAG: XdhC family protein [Acidobacteriota bacterium]
MRDLHSDLERWWANDRRTALATVILTWGSSPRPLGSKMAVADDGAMSGSVSGGCVEGAVVEAAREVLATGRPRLERFGVADEDAFAIGLSCGGTIEVWIEPLAADDLVWRGLVERESARRPCARAVRLATDADKGRDLLLEPGAAPVGALPPDLALRAAELASTAWIEGRAQRDGALFVDPIEPTPRLIVVGAVHAAIPLVTMAKAAGFETIVIDPRTAFATQERFGHADHLSHQWPDEALEELGVDGATYVALLSHDLKLDVPALRVALPKARYVGALGSRKTQARRAEAARAAGFNDDDIARIHGPIGLDLGGRRAEEIAVAVLAQLVAVRHGRDLRAPPATVELGVVASDSTPDRG